MGKVVLDMAMSLDGIVDNDSLYNWYFSSENTKSAAVIAEIIDTTGAILMGKRAYDQADAVDAYLDNPYRVPHFVVTHHIPAKVAAGTTRFTFVTDGIESALQQAITAAGNKDVTIGGGANIARQYLKAGLVDEIQIHLVPVLLGSGSRLFDQIGTQPIELESVRVIESTHVTHLKYRVIKQKLS
jgi:dihydrofolate reductase